MYNGPHIATDGLVLSLDAANNKSYISGSATWRDVSGYEITGSISTGSIYNNSNNIESLLFDGSSGSVSLGSGAGISNIFSISSWVNCSNVAGSNNIVSKNGPYFMRIVSSKVRFNVLAGGTWLFQTGNATLSNNTWYNLVMTYDGSFFKGYINSSLDFSTAKTGSIISNALTYIGYTPSVGEDAGFSGRISNVSIYNTALTQDQVLQNYISQKSRFNL
jgi:hypothetical protein